MKKFALLLSVAAALVLTSCTQKTNSMDETTATTTVKSSTVEVHHDYKGESSTK